MARVLVVDDDAAGLDLRRLILEREGHQVTTAADPPRARAGLSATAPEVVILDLRLPKAEDGLALIREIRASSAAVRIVVLSGWSGDLDGRPERAMVNQVLVKPVRSEAIIGACFR